MHNQAPIQRRKSKRIYVGNVPIGDGAPIAVQSMTNTRTTDVEATVKQIQALERVGADIVRVSVPTMDAAEAFKLIKQQVNVPLVADIHFDYRIALKVAEYGVDCLRINPGNIGSEERIRAVVDCARDKNIPIRIGVNAGSLEKDLQEKYGEPTPQALLESAMRHVEHLNRLNFDQFKVSVKASDVFLAVESYRLLAKEIEQPLHLGITEAGGARAGAVKSAIGLGLGQVVVIDHPAENFQGQELSDQPGQRGLGQGCPDRGDQRRLRFRIPDRQYGPDQSLTQTLRASVHGLLNQAAP